LPKASAARSEGPLRRLARGLFPVRADLVEHRSALQHSEQALSSTSRHAESRGGEVERRRNIGVAMAFIAAISG